MRTWDAIVIGAGIIGLSLAIELNKQGLRVLVVEKGEPGREASWAAGGMLVDFPAETPLALRELATASAGMYPEYVRELEDESGLKIDLRSIGTLVLTRVADGQNPTGIQTYALPQPLAELEPALSEVHTRYLSALFVKERCVDPRDLTAAAITGARNRGIDFSSGDRVMAVETVNGKASGVRTNKTQFGAGLVVNCAGAWAGQIAPHSFPIRPVKGQMLCVIMPEKEMPRHVVRAPDVYLIPRSDGRMLIGATVETCKGSLPVSMGGIAPRNARWPADFRSNRHAGILSGNRTFSGWNSARAGNGKGNGTDDDRTNSAVRFVEILGWSLC